MSKTIRVIYATDAGQHLDKLQEIIKTLKTEKRIDHHSIHPAQSLSASFTNDIETDTMVIVMLTKGLETDKERIEESLLHLKRSQPDSKIVEILIDNIPYENEFIAFPTSLEPISTNEDMHSAWQDISENLKKIFPKEPVPVPIPPSPKRSAWKKFLPYILGLFGLLILGAFMFRNCTGNAAGSVKPESSNEKFKVEILSSKINKLVKVSTKCPEEIECVAILKVSGSGKMKGRWLRSDGTYDDFEYNFKKDEQREIGTLWKFGKPGEEYNREWLQLEILEPVPMLSNKAYFNLKCVSYRAVFVVDDVFSITGRGTVASGKVVTGTIKRGSQVYINDRGSPITCTGIEKFRKITDTASEGEEVGLLLRGISKSDIKRGDKLVIR